MKAINQAELEHYQHHGYLFPKRVLTSEEAANCLRRLSDMETRIGAPLTQADLKWRGASYLYSPWVNALVRDPRVLDLVEDVIGPDILVFWSTFFIKEPGTASFTAWHQDATYFGLEPYEHVTAWIALSDAGSDAGCMDVISSKGAPRQLAHAAARLPDSINGAGQVIVEPFDDSDPVAMALMAGEASLHHTLCCHRSAPNRASHRRVGLGISYIPAHVKPTGSYRMPALCVRGSNKYDHFDLLPDPAEELDAQGIAVHEKTYARFRENYYEQERLHDELFGKPA